MAGISTWRANDIVAYEAMRESANSLTAILLRTSPSDPATPSSAELEIRQLRDAVLRVDGYDRAAVSALASQISNRVAELTESQT